MMELREYQSDLIAKARRSFMDGNRRIILQAPTGAGKTITSAELISSAVSKGKKVLFICHRRELCYQAIKRFTDYGLESGLILAGEETDISKNVVVCTIQTYSRRIKLVDDHGINTFFHDADLIVLDECHASISPTFQDLLKKYYSDKPAIGLTATACRADGRGLGEYYDDIVSSISFGELIKKGFLVPYRYFAPAQIDLSNIKKVAGDYDKKELGHRMDKVELVGDIFDNWAKVAGGRQTIIFAVNVKHSIHIKEKFRANGIECEHIDAKTPKDVRADVLGGLEDGSLQVVTNVGILTEGYDCPAVSCIVLARPTKSYGLYIQMAGRGSRIYKLKQDCILLDHGGCIEEHGVLEEDMDWSLDGKEKAWSKPKKKENETKTVKCTVCHKVFQGEESCPDCGSPIKKYGKEVKSTEDELVELVGKKTSQADKRRFLGMLKAWVPRQKNSNPKRINGSFKGRFGVWPGHNYKYVEPIEPDKEFLNFMRYQAIKYAKRKTT